MGFYIEGPAKGKAKYIVENHGGILLKNQPYLVSDVGVDETIICVVDNGPDVVDC